MSDEYQLRKDIDRVKRDIYTISDDSIKVVQFRDESNLRNLGSIDDIFEYYQLLNLDRKIIDLIYPVGSIYMSVNEIDPSVVFGGSWERIKDRFLLSKGDTYTTTGYTDGEATHTLTVDEMPEHNHRADINLRYLNNGATASESSHVANWSNKYTTQISNSSIDVGGGEAHNNMPPYIVVNVWKRTE